jgi:hypothetical protein
LIGQGLGFVGGFLTGGGPAEDAMMLCRGGGCKAINFLKGSGVTLEEDGTLSGVSVFGGKTVKEAGDGLPVNFPRAGFVSKTVVEEAGGTVSGSGPHYEISGLTAEKLEELFLPTVTSRTSW